MKISGGTKLPQVPTGHKHQFGGWDGNGVCFITDWVSLTPLEQVTAMEEACVGLPVAGLVGGE